MHQSSFPEDSHAQEWKGKRSISNEWETLLRSLLPIGFLNQAIAEKKINGVQSVAGDVAMQR